MLQVCSSPQKREKAPRAQIRQTTGDITSDLVDSVQKSRQQLLKAVEVIRNKAQGFKSMVFNDKTKETEALLEEEINKKEMAAA
ncbi:MAG: hypothetical protein R2822_02830 [Spirosomataceae bacterium]